MGRGDKLTGAGGLQQAGTVTVVYTRSKVEDKQKAAYDRALGNDRRSEQPARLLTLGTKHCLLPLTPGRLWPRGRSATGALLTYDLLQETTSWQGLKEGAAPLPGFPW